MLIEKNSLKRVGKTSRGLRTPNSFGTSYGRRVEAVSMAALFKQGYPVYVSCDAAELDVELVIGSSSDHRTVRMIQASLVLSNDRRTKQVSRCDAVSVLFFDKFDYLWYRGFPFTVEVRIYGVCSSGVGTEK